MSETNKKYTAAVVQHPPVFLDRDATVERACKLIAEAAAEGAKIAAFPEAYVPGYPTWVSGTAAWANQDAKRLYAVLADNSLEVGGEALATLQATAAEHRIHVVMGATERDAQFSRGSLYNSLFFIDDRGELLGVHRKLTPTHTERLVWGMAADGSAVTPHATDIGRVGGLICWEHWMPVTRFAMHAQGEQVHVAAWPELWDLHHVASRHYAFEGKCYVLAAGLIQRIDEFPDDPALIEATKALLPDGIGSSDEVLFPGASGIIGPDGMWVSGPAGEESTIVYGEIDLDRITEEQYGLDTVGHYHRPDIYSVTVQAEKREPIKMVEGGPSAAPTDAVGPETCE